MRTLFTVCAIVLAAIALGGCPIHQSNEATEDTPPQVTPVAPEIADTEGGAPTGDLPPALARSRVEDRAVLEPILAYLEGEQANENAAGLETANWVSYEAALEENLLPEDLGEDAMIYKIVEEDAWLSVLFGPPFSEFYLEFRLAATDDGSFEVIGCELLPELGEE